MEGSVKGVINTIRGWFSSGRATTARPCAAPAETDGLKAAARRLNQLTEQTIDHLLKVYGGVRRQREDMYPNLLNGQRLQRIEYFEFTTIIGAKHFLLDCQRFILNIRGTDDPFVAEWGYDKPGG
jgi:hypothetical protein